MRRGLALKKAGNEILTLLGGREIHPINTRALGQLPPRCIVYAIEGASFEAGAALTPAVASAVADVAQRLRADLFQWFA